MKIVETITPINADKVFLGKKEITFTFDTDTGRVTIDEPAMFVDPIVPLDDLLETLNKLKEHDNIRDIRGGSS